MFPPPPTSAGTDSVPVLHGNDYGDVVKWYTALFRPLDIKPLVDDSDAPWVEFPGKLCIRRDSPASASVEYVLYTGMSAAEVEELLSELTALHSSEVERQEQDGRHVVKVKDPDENDVWIVSA